MATLKPTLPALIVRGAIDDLATIRELAHEPEAVREIAGGAAARLERALEELDPDPETQVCRDCGAEFPYDPEADYCPRCAAENAGEHDCLAAGELEFVAHYAAPGSGQSWRCRSCGRPWAKLGDSFVDPSTGAHILEPGDVI